jgi:hypothetical protein
LVTILKSPLPTESYTIRGKFAKYILEPLLN